MTTGVLTTSFPRYPGDFAGCFVEDAVRQQIRAGEIVEVIAANDPNAAMPPDGGDTDGDGDGANDGGKRDSNLHRLAASRPDLGPSVTVIRVDMPAVPASKALFYGTGAPERLEKGGLGGWGQAVFFWAGLCGQIRARAPSWRGIVAHWLLPCALAARAAAPHLPLTAYAHSGDIALLERIPGGAALGRLLARETRDLIFVSANLKNRFSRLTGVATGRISSLAPHVAQAASDAAAGAWSRGPALSGRDASIILSVGRLVHIKGFDVLVRALALAQLPDLVDAERPPTATAAPGGKKTTLVILGEGPERARLEATARRLNVDLVLPGTVPRSRVHQWMREADVYVQPSRVLANGRSEGLPVATLEALEIGVPVIASRTGGLSELAHLPGVRLVPPSDFRILAETLRSALTWAPGDALRSPSV